MADGAPVGVHRAPRGAWSKVWPFLLVALICAALAVAAVAILSQTGDTSDDAAPPVTQETSAPPTEGTEETPSAEPTDAAPSDEASATPSEDPAGDVDALVAAADPTAYVRVLNESAPAGEAGKAESALEAKGFTNVVAANPTAPTGASGTVVWYVEGRAETAAAVAAVLGIPAEQTSQVNLREGEVVVVLQGAIQPVG
ncbi:LytR cell envelope-related transcriptional attenuator [Sediminihabitans luteus]|uniref:LytR cell envelope-related transcriptional attenuator n=1 Tax=Sediminihabitans luteus TaxID=1138585 RepID=A0A2M9CE69_9CELL|nr:LytR cell envelope-related transcriptional attenuator [Sediminihabitans luteus]